MNIEEIREYCIQKKAVSEGFPFDQDTLVFKAMNKMFALMSLEKAEFINLKCDPERAISLREEYDFIKEGYHMSKKHWNSVYYKTEISDNMLKELIDHSYDLIIQSLPKKVQIEYKEL